MDEKEKDHEATARTREHLETSRERAVVFRTWAMFAMLAVLTLAVLYGIKSWIDYNHVGGATSAKLNGTLDNLNALIAVLQGKANEADVKPILTELKGEIQDLRGTTTGATAAEAALTRRIEQLGGNLASVQALTDEGRRSMSALVGTRVETPMLDANGKPILDKDGKPKMVVTGTGLVGLVQNADGQIFGPSGLIPQINVTAGHINDTAALLNDTKTGIPVILRDLDKNLQDLDVIEVTANGDLKKIGTLIGDRIETPVLDKAGKPVLDRFGKPKVFVSGTGLIGSIENANGVTGDVREYVDNFLHPAPVTGFWKNFKKDFLFAADLFIEGGKAYYILHSLGSLPVRLTAPIPQK
jgi:cob(I)alamin adenosyltransferase